IWILSDAGSHGDLWLLSSIMSERRADREEDYRFLHSMLMEKKLHLLFKIHERLRRFQKRSLLPVREQAAGMASDLAAVLTPQSWSDEARELAALMSQPHFKGLLSVHDAVAQRDFEPTLAPVPDHVLGEEEEEEDSVKIVSLVKTKEPLGATIKRDKASGAIVVARIMRGGPADRSVQGLIHEGDELREVNGVSLENRKPKEIPSLLARSQKEVRFTIVPAFSKEETPPNEPKLFVRALFDYDPGEDPAVPCKDAAVAFRRGDVLQVVSAEDDAWWQACHQRDGRARAGLGPSAHCSGRRMALQRPRALFKPERVKAPAGPVVEDVDYGAITGIHIAGLRRSFRLGKKSSRVRRAAGSRRWSAGGNGSNPPPAYREVIPYRRDPGDGRRLVVLVGPDGVGVSELKRRLLISDPDCYGVTVPYTTRERRKQESEGVDYHFLSVHAFEESILNNGFIEYGHYGGHYYGTSVDSVRKVMAEGKVCLLDVDPSVSERKSAQEFMPYVVFVKPPRLEELRLTRRRAKFIEHTRVGAKEEDLENMIDLAETMENQCGHLFDKVIVNGDATAAFRELRADLQRVDRAEVQWIPPEWLC
uniref:Membrane protein, palmitoylated 7b (MAGUK p55 subfamily member 7) n=1 Tax=Tetraodon nigroviridis TaxID=99883 RepID=H3CR16_TETNG